MLVKLDELDQFRRFRTRNPNRMADAERMKTHPEPHTARSGHELPLESWRVSLCGRLAWCHPRVMGWRLQRGFFLNLSSLCVTDLTAVAIHNASTTAVALVSGDACSGKPPFTGHFCGTGICESPGQA